MALKDEIELIVKEINDRQMYLQHNAVLLDILDGNLLQYIMDDLKKQLSPQSYETIKHRISPINMLKRVMDKKSRIYSGGVVREVQNGSETDNELLSFYIESMNLKSTMPLSNVMFNLHKGNSLEPYINSKMQPKLRVLPFDRFLVLGLDPVEPERVTHFVKCMGSYKDVARAYNLMYKESFNSDMKVYYVYTESEFIIITNKGEIQYELMNILGNDIGVNPLGVLPQVYINKSQIEVMPTQDTDVLRMTKLIPVLLSDLNFAVMFQSFSVVYGVDLSISNLEFSPSAFWDLKSDPASNKEPKVGVIKPEVEIQTVMNFIMSQIALWLQSQNIRPGATGEASPEQFASGIAKIVDESDTSEDRKQQVNYYIDAEKNLWDLIMHHYHPYWVANGMIDTKLLFTPTATVSVTFPEQKPEIARTVVLDEQIKELEANLTTTKRALMKLNPDLSNDQIEELMDEIEEENTIEVEEESEEENGDASNSMGEDEQNVEEETGEEETERQVQEGSA